MEGRRHIYWTIEIDSRREIQNIMGRMDGWMPRTEMRMEKKKIPIYF
jgi:hypothetical protein